MHTSINYSWKPSPVYRQHLKRPKRIRQQAAQVQKPKPKRKESAQ